MNNKKRSNREALKYFGMISQFGLNIIVCFGIWLFLALYLQDKFNLGSWIVLIGIIFGCISAGYTVSSFFKMAMRDAKKSEEEYKKYINGENKE